MLFSWIRQKNIFDNEIVQQQLIQVIDHQIIEQMLSLVLTYHFSKSFYKRNLPSHLVQFTCTQGRHLLQQSFKQGHAQSFPNLIQQFVTQQQPSTCGSASLAIILNALHVDPGYNWKGIWRWYDDYNIRGLTPQHIKQGITLQQWDVLAKHNGIQSIHFYPFINNIQQNSTYNYIRDQQIEDCIKASTRRSQFFMTANFSRRVLGQTGIGHFSPIAAYNAQQKMVLLLDVAKFKYPLYWCPINMLIQALRDIDNDSGLPRGIILNKKVSQGTIQSVICDWQIDYKLNDILYSKINHGLKNGRSIIPLYLQIFNHEAKNLLIPILYDLNAEPNIINSIAEELSNYPEINQLKHSSQYDNVINLVYTFIKDNMKYFLYMLHYSMCIIHRVQPSINLPPNTSKFIRKMVSYLDTIKK